MGLGSTAKKIQKISDVAEKLYANIRDVRERVVSLEESADETNERVTRLERRVQRQSAILEAMAEQQGIDVEATVDEADIEPVEAETDDEGSDEPSNESDADGGGGADEDGATADGGEDDPAS